MARSNWEPNVWKKMGRNDHKIRENVKKEKMEEDEEEGRKKELERARENTKGMWVFGVISTNFMIISSETRERWPWTGMVGSRNIKKKIFSFPAGCQSLSLGVDFSGRDSVLAFLCF